MDIVKKHLTNGQYLTHEYEKDSIFLHHTVGTNAMSAWRWWNATPERVGTPYIIDRDGSIIECFDPKMWAFHLGIKGDDNYHEKHSINIELVSAGPLRLIEGKYIFYPLWPNKLHFTEIPKEEVHTFSKAWKGYKYWHAFTEDQMESLIWLIGRLALDFPNIVIENEFSMAFEFNKDVYEKHIPGIWTHNTVRKDKSDPFPQPELIKAVEQVQKELVNIRKAPQIEEVKITPKKTSTKRKTTSSKSRTKKPKTDSES